MSVVLSEWPWEMRESRRARERRLAKKMAAAILHLDRADHDPGDEDRS